MSISNAPPKERFLPLLIVAIPVLSVLLVALLVSYIFVTHQHETMQLEAEVVENAVLEQSRDNLRREVSQVIRHLASSHADAEQMMRRALRERTQSAKIAIEKLHEQYRGKVRWETLDQLVKINLASFSFDQGDSFYELYRLPADNGVLKPMLLSPGSALEISTAAGALLEPLSGKQSGFVQLADYVDGSDALLYVTRLNEQGLVLAAVQRLDRFEARLKQQLLQRLSEFRYGDDGYLFVYDADGNYLMNPMDTALVGRSVCTLRNTEDQALKDSFIQAGHTPEGRFVEYRWHRPESEVLEDKISFARPYSRWGWVVATGVYVEDAVHAAEAEQQALRQRVDAGIRRALLAVGVFVLVIFAGTLLVARYTSRLLQRYQRRMRRQNLELNEWNSRLEEGIAQRTEQLEAKNTELRRLSSTDALTGLSNRLRLDQFFERVLGVARRYGRPFSVVLMDLDHFKRINDTWGHPTGDEVLIKMGELLRKAVREVDIAGRWGGEEFVVILPETTVKQACLVADKLRVEVLELDVLPVTELSSSFGVAEYQTDDSIEKLIGRADAALYRAKEKGRNRVESG